MFWMRAYPLCGEVGGGWALEFSSFLGPVKWERADRRVPFGAIYAPMIYTAPCIMFWMHAYPLHGEVGGGWALEVSSFVGPV
jgi:hypothetical protein